MYNTRLEVLEAIAAKYENATALSIDDRGACFYWSRGIEGTPGCAIGCLFAPKQAKQLDKYVGTIGELCRDRRAKPIIASVFNLETIEIADLAGIQWMHDQALTVDDFVMAINDEIARTKRMRGSR